MHRWLLWTVLAVFCWGIWALIGKLIGESLNPSLTQALSTVGSLPVILALGLAMHRQKVERAYHQPGGRLALEGGNVDEAASLSRLRRRGALLSLGAGTLTCLGNIAYYGMLSRGAKAATVVPLTALYPVVTVLLAVVILKEQLNPVQMAGIALSLIAIYLFNVQQEQGFLSAWLLVALVPIALWGITGFLQKLATNDISGELSTLWFLAAFVPVAICILALGSWPGGINLGTWLLVSALGFTLALGNFALLAAFASNGKASVIAPLAGLYPVVSIPIAIVFLHEQIGWREAVGIAFALISAVALSWGSPETQAGSPTTTPKTPI